MGLENKVRSQLHLKGLALFETLLGSHCLGTSYKSIWLEQILGWKLIAGKIPKVSENGF